MRFIDDAARINYQNWNKGGRYENHYGAREALNVNLEDFRAFLNGLIEAGLTIQGVSEESDESTHFDEPLKPGSELHKRSIVPLYFGVLGRKP
jgi:hypothetical protein